MSVFLYIQSKKYYCTGFNINTPITVYLLPLSMGHTIEIIR